MRISPEKREEKERVRLALVEAALRLAALHGFASLGLREVSRAASIAPTSFYRHFADMEELGISLIEQRVTPLVAALCARAQGDEAALSVLDALLAHADEEPALLRFLLAERVGAAPAFRKALRTKLAPLVSALQRAGERDTAQVAAPDADAAVVLVLEGCARVLDDPAVRERVRAQLGAPLRKLLMGEPRTEPSARRTR